MMFRWKLLENRKKKRKRKENLFMHCKIQPTESGKMYICSTFNILKVIDSPKHLHTGNGVQRGSFASTTRWFSDNFPDARCGKLSRDNDATWQIWCNQICSCFLSFPKLHTNKDHVKATGLKNCGAERKAGWSTLSLNTQYLRVTPYDVNPIILYVWLK